MEEELKNLESVNPEWFSVDQKVLTPPDNAEDILREVPLFHGLKGRDWREIIKILHERTYKKDEIIFQEGTPGLGMYIIVEGSVTIYTESEGRRINLADFNVGQFFGEMTLIDNSNRSATAIANETTRLMAVFRPQLEILMRTYPRLGRDLLLRLSRIIVFRLRVTNQQLTICRTSLSELEEQLETKSE